MHRSAEAGSYALNLLRPSGGPCRRAGGRADGGCRGLPGDWQVCRVTIRGEAGAAGLQVNGGCCAPVQ